MNTTLSSLSHETARLDAQRSKGVDGVKPSSTEPGAFAGLMQSMTTEPAPAVPTPVAAPASGPAATPPEDGAPAWIASSERYALRSDPMPASEVVPAQEDRAAPAPDAGTDGPAPRRVAGPGAAKARGPGRTEASAADASATEDRAASRASGKAGAERDATTADGLVPGSLNWWLQQVEVPAAPVPGAETSAPGGAAGGAGGAAPELALAAATEAVASEAAAAMEPAVAEAAVSGQPDFAALMASTSRELASSGATAPSSTPVHLSLATPVHDPGFGEAVAVQVARWTGEGVQQATLDLSPLELGPIQIRIDVDGNQASIDFSAARPETRALLESAMASLADALRQDGLELGASSVSESVAPSGGDRSGGDADRSRGGDASARPGEGRSGSGQRQDERAAAGTGWGAGSGLDRTAWSGVVGASAAHGPARRPGGLDLYA